MSMIWKLREKKEAPKKFKQSPFVGKAMLMAIRDLAGFIYTEFTPERQNVNKGNFNEFNHLKNAIKAKLPGLLSKEVLLLRGTERPQEMVNRHKHSSNAFAGKYSTIRLTRWI